MTQDDKPPLARFLDQNPNFPYWFNTSLSILLTLIGSITIFQLLTTPVPHFPESTPQTMCRAASGLVSTPEDIDVSMDVAESRTRDHCGRVREDRIASAIFVAIPTTIIGSVTATALIFRRTLSPAPVEEPTSEK